jgi:hypothetical protein
MMLFADTRQGGKNRVSEKPSSVLAAKLAATPPPNYALKKYICTSVHLLKVYLTGIVHDTYKLNYPFFVYEFGIRF